MLKYLRGWLEVEITGAAPELCINRLAARDIPFWGIERVDDFTLRLRVYAAHWSRAEPELTRAMCAGKILRRAGFRQTFYGLKRRPVVLLGLMLALALALLAQNFVWFLQVEGNEQVPAERILRTLEEEGVRFGVWGPNLDTQYLKNRMLNRIPELRWLAVNREGCVAHILVAERTPEEPPLERSGVANVVAARDGRITELRVLNGFAAVEVGDAVLEGQLLISGLADWTTHTQATRAIAEVYADTVRRVELKMPDQFGEKCYTGREEVCRSVIFQSFRRKISGNSGIFGTSCDKMVETVPLTLPGGYKLPFTLETVTLREYTLKPKTVPAQMAESALEAWAEELAKAEMTAGVVQTANTELQQENGAYYGRVTLNCNELISRTQPILLFGEDEQNGENNQRGAN